MRYVALGDSYTIGTSVREAERWPNQLVDRLGESAARASAERRLELVANLAVNGFTSADVIRTQLPRLPTLAPAVVSLLVGVNDVIRGVREPAYRANLDAILDALAAVPSVRLVFGVTTPDYTVTPAGSDYGDPAAVAASIRGFNAAFSEVLARRQIPVIDVHDLSLAAADEPSLVARDGLHPSGDQYSRWVDRMAPRVRTWLAALDAAAATGGMDGGEGTDARSAS